MFDTLLYVACWTCNFTTVVAPEVNDQLSPLILVKMKGFVGNKMDASNRNRIMVQDVDRLVALFRNRTEDRCWQSEFWGKWFTSAVLAYRYKPERVLVWPELAWAIWL